MFVRFGPTPAHEELSNFWYSGSLEVSPLSRTLLKVGILFWGHPYVGVPVIVDASQ